MRKSSMYSFALGVASVLCLECVIPPATSAAQAQAQAPSVQPASANQLDQLLAPIALYPDPLLAQVLVAATFPDQVDAAAQYVRAQGTVGIEDQPWDVSVKAVAHYPTVLNMMDDKLDWTRSLGEAYASQSSDVMQSVQRLRGEAQAQGNLVTTPQQQVVTQNGAIMIWPAQPQYIYVPIYNPALIYYQPMFVGGLYPSRYFFSVAFPIGPWLVYDWNWWGGGIYYTGWVGGGWIARSRPFIGVGFGGFGGVYLNSRFRTVAVGSPFGRNFGAVNRVAVGRAGINESPARSNGLYRTATSRPLIARNQTRISTDRGWTSAPQARTSQPMRSAQPMSQSRGWSAPSRAPSYSRAPASRGAAPARGGASHGGSRGGGRSR